MRLFSGVAYVYFARLYMFVSYANVIKLLQLLSSVLINLGELSTSLQTSAVFLPKICHAWRPVAGAGEGMLERGLLHGEKPG